MEQTSNQTTKGTPRNVLRSSSNNQVVAQTIKAVDTLLVVNRSLIQEFIKNFSVRLKLGLGFLLQPDSSLISLDIYI
ncbi:hypothetical protein MKX01_020993 [Papaver californicum]|nr:hypothetical protein MKX01_020993 [Papaver californicum]